MRPASAGLISSSAGGKGTRRWDGASGKGNHLLLISGIDTGVQLTMPLIFR